LTYGADGLRRSMTTGGVTTSFLLDRQNVAQEIQNGSPLATYLVGPRGVEYRQDASGQRRWYIYDGLGSVIAEVDQDGKVNPDQQGNETPLRKYDVYGAIRNSQEVAPGTSSHKFVGSLGHTTEDDTGLIYMRARYYDPAIGRFISEDPGRNGANWCAYCNNNPVNLVDPDGCSVLDYTLGSYLFDLSVGGLLIALGRWMVRNTDNAILGYVLGGAGGGLVGVGAALLIKTLADVVGRILRRYVDSVSRELWRKMERAAQDQASALTAGVRLTVYGQQMMVLGWISEE